MSFEITVGSRLIALKERANLSLAQIAKAAGYQGASSIQKLFRPDYNPERLQESVATRLASALAGHGDPVVHESEVLALAGEGEIMSKLLADLQHFNFVASAYVGIHRTRRIDQYVEAVDGQKTPLFVREDMSSGILVHPTPDFLRPRSIVGLYVTVGNMWPRFEENEPVFYEHKRPPSRGDDVLVEVGGEQELNGGLLIARLALLSDNEVQLDQLSPSGRINLPRSSVISIRRLMHASDFLPPATYAT